VEVLVRVIGSQEKVNYGLVPPNNTPIPLKSGIFIRNSIRYLVLGYWGIGVLG